MWRSAVTMLDPLAKHDPYPWRDIAQRARARWGSPSYLFSWELVLDALHELRAVAGPLPVRHWLSFKTLPLRPLLVAWERLGLGVEVVSRFELLAALREGYPPERILVNGVAKHRWLDDIDAPGLTVHLDSRAELEALADRAAEQAWRIGLRFHPSNETDTEEPEFPDQFGFSASELRQAAGLLRSRYPRVEGLHFHLRSNVPRVDEYLVALDELALLAGELDLTPAYVDCGGGFPVAGEWTRDGLERRRDFRLADAGLIVERVARRFPTAREVWLENGRFLTARAGVLVTAILDVKERPAARYLICDGGRTNHAIVSDWEHHRVVTAPERRGRPTLTTVCGPTCMSFDRLGRFELPRDLGPGDLLLWMNAGAYHSAWESRFSHGLAAVVWIDETRRASLVRSREGFRQWWDGLASGAEW